MFEEFFKDFFTSIHGWITIIFVIIVITLLVGLLKTIIPPEDNYRGGQGNVIVVNQQTGKQERRHRDRDDSSERDRSRH